MSPAQRRRYFPRVILIFLVLGIGLAGLIVWNLSRPVTDARVQAIHAKGYPVTLKELDASYKPPPDSENAALILTNAFAKPLLASNLADNLLVARLLPARGKPLSPDDKIEFAALLATNKGALDLLYQAAKLKASRYPIDLTQGAFTLLPHLSKIKSATGILATQGLILAQDGDSEDAVRAFVAAARTADSLAEEPLMISQLVRYAAWNALFQRLERALNLGNFADPQLAELQQTIASGERSNSLALAFIGERSGSLAVFSESRHQTAMLSGQWDKTTSGERLKSQLAVGLMKATGLYSKDKDFFLDSMSNFVWAAEQPHPERWNQNLALPAPIAPNRFWVFSRMLLPALNKATKRDVEHAAKIRVTQIALAVERFRIAHANALPETLEELVPAFCTAIPHDPFAGAPVRYKKLEKGYVVYSLGADGKDDGGVEYDPKIQAGYDITFTIEK